MKDLRDKIAVVTGAAQGIGRGIAEALCAAGMKVVLSDIDEQALSATTRALSAASADVLAVPTDVSQPGHLERLAQETLRKYGAVHVLCNNAGIFVGGQCSWENSIDDWRWTLGVNVMGIVHGIHTFLPIMIEQGSEAHIVNTASTGGLLSGVSALYGTAKFAVVGLTENLHAELQRSGAKPRISLLCPGLVNTEFMFGRHIRPAEFGAAPEQTAAQLQAVASLRDLLAPRLKAAMTARAVGEEVVKAIQEERLYILTHPGVNAAIEQRVRNIVTGKDPMVPLGIR